MTSSLLLLAERFPPDLGGLARSGGRIAAALSRLGPCVDVLTWTRGLPPGRLETTPATDRLTVHRLGLFGAQDTSMQYTLNVLEWLHEERAFSALWGHYLQPAGFLAVLFGSRVGLPTTVSARGNDLDRTLFPPGDFARLAWTLERATLVTAASRALKTNIDLLLGRDRALVLNNAVDPDLFAPGPPDASLRAALGIAPEEAVLGFSGELRLKKGLPFLLDALVEVRRIRPACLLVIGEIRGRDTLLIDAFGAEHPEDASRLIVTGHLAEPTQVAAHLRLCDLFLHPSLWEGLPNALLEAMACGIPVLASDAGGIPEALAGCQGGRMLPRKTLHRLGEAALELLDLSFGERKAMGLAGRQRILSGFHPGVEAANLQRILALLGVKSSSRPNAPCRHGATTAEEPDGQGPESDS